MVVRCDSQTGPDCYLRREFVTIDIPLCTLPDGYWRVPRGKLANATVWMEMREPVADERVSAVTLRSVPAINTPELRLVFNLIGASSLWDRTAQLNQDVHATPWGPDDFLYFAFDDTERHVGLVELANRRDGSGAAEIEISYMGLFPQYIGKGLGRELMTSTLAMAWKLLPRRVYLHTCNTDHPSAFAFYRATGFVPYAAGVQMMDDPRARGWLPADAAPHVPYVDTR